MLNSHNLRKYILVVNTEEEIAKKTQKRIGKDLGKITRELSAFDSFFNPENKNNKYQNIRDNFYSNGQEFYNYLSKTLSEFSEKETPIKQKQPRNYFNPSPTKREVFEYRIFINREKQKIIEEINSSEKILKRLKLPTQKTFTHVKFNFEKATEEYFKYLDSELRKIELN